MNFHYKADPSELKVWQRGSENSMARAATKAMRELAKIVEKRGRAEITRGLSKRFARYFFARAKPKAGYSINASMRGYLRTRAYLNVFEHGSSIVPRSKKRKFFWVPLPNIPQKIGGKRMTPALFEEKIGPLFSSRKGQRPGESPLLFGEISGSTSGKLSVARLRTGASNGDTRRKGGTARRTVRVPVFVGITQAQMPKKLNVGRIYGDAVAEYPRLYAQQMLVALERGNGT